MAPKRRVIIDTDPGIDDVLALLLALSSKAEEIELLCISLTFGNIGVQKTLKNAVSMFHLIEQEIQWRRKNGRHEGFEALKANKPILAVGAERPLSGQTLLADYFHGLDGLGDIHTSHPHLAPPDSYEKLFSHQGEYVEGLKEAVQDYPWFSPSSMPAHKQILDLLKKHEPDSITIVAVGPLTNLALAAAEDPETFLRVHEVVVMGGAIDIAGNVTPSAEFNTFADPTAAARVYALTSAKPNSTMPPEDDKSGLGPYPESLSKKLTVKLAPLDLTRDHPLTRGLFRARVASTLDAGSPLAEWLSAILGFSFRKLDSLHPGHEGDLAALSLHDPVCVWYALTADSDPQGWKVTEKSPVDLRVETTGQWTRGMCVVDRRSRKRRENDETSIDDYGQWLGKSSGNRIDVLMDSPGADSFGGYMLDKLFGTANVSRPALSS